MSAKHAVIACDVAGAETPDEYKVTITDFSRHGVFVNGEKIEPGAPAPLEPDDVVTLPFGLEYRFELPRDAPRPAPAPRDGKDGKKAQKTPGSKKKAAGTPGAAKRAAARGDDVADVAAKRAKNDASPQSEKGGVALAFDDASASPNARARTQDALEAAKKLETANAELRARLERAEKVRDASAAEREEEREAARDAARAAAAAPSARAPPRARTSTPRRRSSRRRSVLLGSSRRRVTPRWLPERVPSRARARDHRQGGGGEALGVARDGERRAQEEPGRGARGERRRRAGDA